MENASKALLISAAILIVIILIAFGVKIVSGGQGSVDSAQKVSSDMNMASFNAQFAMYKGTISSSELRTLINLVNKSNQINPEHKVAFLHTKSLGRKDVMNSTEYILKAGAGPSHTVSEDEIRDRFKSEKTRAVFNNFFEPGPKIDEANYEIYFSKLDGYILIIWFGII